MQISFAVLMHFFGYGFPSLSHVLLLSIHFSGMPGSARQKRFFPASLHKSGYRQDSVKKTGLYLTFTKNIFIFNRHITEKNSIWYY